ncbi:T9SS type A sorting domain-containing protein [Aquimarina sp. TRL1]|uniref:T9SS type A sorting domain-containing protein n=1 Tax=Aquimarina sp. (strain TRL1) TaxID=2736252 RepID=UPI00158BCD79|nr:T9SS type A sorting domain-containing protein [Aquimarina sp. TRL1]QKX05266.1 T9SS type A sorting domain-containing protein [Aquimarina sp. TRL1]
MKFQLITLLLFFSLTSYTQNFKEIQLPTPTKITNNFIGPLFHPTIHYGATPENYNGKVIVFNHGYIDLNQSQFLFKNTFYQDVFNEGYQAVFVATTRGEGLWTNGKLLASALDIITHKYGIPQVYLIAHSNGGKAAEAAMFHYGKKDKVANVFALGTPFWGTYLADISQVPLLNWIWKLTGLNEGARTSTTYYCRDIVRPYFDKHPSNQPQKFISFGASGFYNSSVPIAAPVFLVSGGVLLAKQGSNDGVAPYSSTLRPNATIHFKDKDPNAIFDHLDISFGQFSWKHIRPYIENDNKRTFLETTSLKPSTTSLESNYYLIQSDKEHRLHLEKSTSKTQWIDIIHKKENAIFQTSNTHNKKKDIIPVHKIPHRTILQPTKKDMALHSDSAFIAFVKDANGPVMSFSNEISSQKPFLEVSFTTPEKEKFSVPTNFDVWGVIYDTSSEDINDPEEIINFTKNGNKFVFDPSVLPHGVYSIIIHATNHQNIKRNLISGFVLGNEDPFMTFNPESTTPKEQPNIVITPSVIEDTATISILTPPPYDATITVYTIHGQKVLSLPLPESQNNSYDISGPLQKLQSGVYLLKYDTQKAIRFIKK